MIKSIAAASLVYLDSQVFIYFIEDHPTFAPLVQPLIAAIDRGEKFALSSVLTLAEVLVKPHQLARTDLLNGYSDLLLGTPNLHMLAINEEIATRAAEIRARHSFRLPDAVQLAAATVGGADVFVTNDRALRSFGGIPIVVLSDHVQAH